MKQFINFKSLFLNLLIFLFPLFFLPFTQEFYLTHKFYLLAFGVLLILLISTFQFLVSKKLSWSRTPFETVLFLWLIVNITSIVVSSPNKIQALLNPTTGFAVFLFLTILYFIIVNSSTFRATRFMLHLSSLLLSIVTIVFFFNPLKSINLPQSLQFLKSPQFTLLGTQLDLALFLGFFVVYGLTVILGTPPWRGTPESGRADSGQARMTKKSNITLHFALLTFNLVALSLTIYALLKPISTNSTNSNQFNRLTLPPFSVSWYAAVETLKNPKTAFFGVGPDNFAAIFTQAKPIGYNQTALWNINFNQSRSFILQLWTETGLLGLIAFGLLIFSALRMILADKKRIHADNPFLLSTFYFLLIFLFFPPSLPVLFLFFFSLSSIVNHKSSIVNPQSFDLSNLLPIYLGTAIISFVFITGLGYLLGRSYAAEYYFRQSLQGWAKNNIKDLYDNQRRAVIINPYIERFRVNFSQVNLLIANNIAAKANQPTPTNSINSTDNSNQLTEQDKQTISQAIQAAIGEAKATAALNPQKAENWENLAVVYRNILNVAQGADAWTVSAYQRAIVADPVNPSLRLNLGGVYYSLGNWEEAAKLFEQSINLKEDWANSHYNLAWASFQKKDYRRAVTELQNTLNLVDPKSEDYKKGQKELEEFKKMLPKEETATQEGELAPQELNLPPPISPVISPKIQLPEEASPEAK